MKYISAARLLVRRFGQTLWPERCCGCDAVRPVDEHGFCPGCAANIVFWHNHPAAPVRHAARYEGPLQAALCRFKYRGKKSCARKFARLAADQIRQDGFPACDVLIPVPLHWRKVFTRGFNQSQLLGLYVSRYTGIPLRTGILVKLVNTPSQTGLDHGDRRENVRDSFAVRRPAAVKGRRVLLLDDVYTTGATTGEAARVLRRAGADKVVILTIAKT